MGCNFSCTDPEYLNQPLEVNLDSRCYYFNKRPKDLKSLYEILPETEVSKSLAQGLVFEYSSHEGVKQLTDDILLSEAYITHSNKKLIIGKRQSITKH